jgi:hypothetical protein
MTKNAISKNLSRLEFAAAVVKQLKTYHISCVLVGGACVSIYTREKYVSDDLDFISPYSQTSIAEALEEIGLIKEGRYFIHENSPFYVEFPSGPVSIGNRKGIIPEGMQKVNGVEIHMLSPTQSVMDRLAAWYHWKDRRSFFQALDIAKDNEVDFEEVKKWSREEGESELYTKFIEQLALVKR